MELLLLSNSTLPGKAWLEHALPLIAGQVKGRRKAVFIPFGYGAHGGQRNRYPQRRRPYRRH